MHYLNRKHPQFLPSDTSFFYPSSLSNHFFHVKETLIYENQYTLWQIPPFLSIRKDVLTPFILSLEDHAFSPPLPFLLSMHDPQFLSQLLSIIIHFKNNKTFNLSHGILIILTGYNTVLPSVRSQLSNLLALREIFDSKTKRVITIPPHISFLFPIHKPNQLSLAELSRFHIKSFPYLKEDTPPLSLLHFNTETDFLNLFNSPSGFYSFYHPVFHSQQLIIEQLPETLVITVDQVPSLFSSPTLPQTLIVLVDTHESLNSFLSLILEFYDNNNITQEEQATILKMNSDQTLNLPLHLHPSLYTSPQKHIPQIFICPKYAFSQFYHHTLSSSPPIQRPFAHYPPRFMYPYPTALHHATTACVLHNIYKDTLEHLLHSIKDAFHLQKKEYMALSKMIDFFIEKDLHLPTFSPFLITQILKAEKKMDTFKTRRNTLLFFSFILCLRTPSFMPPILEFRFRT